MPSSLFPFTVNFRGVHQHRIFASPAELADWIGLEHEGFQAFAVNRPNTPNEPYASLYKAFRALDLAKNYANKLLDLDASDESKQFVETMKLIDQQLLTAYVNKGLPPSTSAMVEALRPWLKAEPIVSMAALCALSVPQDEVPISHWNRNLAMGFALAAGISHRGDQANADSALVISADKMISSVNLRADTTHQRVTEQIRLADEAQSRANKAWDTHNEDYDKLVSSLTLQVDEVIQQADKKITDFKNGYQSEIALKEPVKFWEAKGENHQRRARLFAISGFVAAAGYGVAAALYLPGWLQPAVQTSVPTVPISNAPSFYGIALTIALTTLALWLIRILVRGYFSQTHLATDAEERVAMVKTYLALMESGKAPGDTLTPVLAALFRPASDGLVKDDSMPVGVAEFLTKQRN